MALILGTPKALKRFHVGVAPVATQQPLVLIEGRTPGAGGFLLSAMGIDVTSTLIVTERDVVFRSGNIFGQVNSMMPLTAVASVHAGYTKPVQYLVVAALCAFGGLVAAAAAQSALPLLASGVLALVFVVLYAVRKSFSVAVESSGGMAFGLTFMSGVIEGVPVDLQRVQGVVDLTRELIIAAQRGGSAATSSMPPGHMASGVYGMR